VRPFFDRDGNQQHGSILDAMLISRDFVAKNAKAVGYKLQETKAQAKAREAALNALSQKDDLGIFDMLQLPTEGPVSHRLGETIPRRKAPVRLSDAPRPSAAPIEQDSRFQHVLARPSEHQPDPPQPLSDNDGGGQAEREVVALPAKVHLRPAGQATTAAIRVSATAIQACNVQLHPNV